MKSVVREDSTQGTAQKDHSVGQLVEEKWVFR